MGTKSSRERKINWMRSQINSFFDKQPEGVIDEEKLLATFALENISTERTGKEILDLFCKVGRIIIKGGEIYNGRK